MVTVRGRNFSADSVIVIGHSLVSAIQFVDTQTLTFPAGGSPPPGPSCTAAPDTPTDVTYTVAINRVTAKWTPATTGCPATTYILRGFTGGTQLTELDAGNVTTFDFPAVVPTGQYTVQLVARNVNGDSAPAVDSVNVP